MKLSKNKRIRNKQLKAENKNRENLDKVWNNTFKGLVGDFMYKQLIDRTVKDWIKE